MQLVFLMVAVSLRRAWLMRRACRPTWESPMSPSNSALGTRAATESTTTRSMALDRTRASAISRACSPVSGWETSKLSMSTPSLRAYWGSRACSASMKAAMPPALWASAIIWRATVVLPEASGPKTSTTRPRGMPPTPRATSRERIPVERVAIFILALSPNFMMAPLPNCFSIPASARSSAF